VNLDKFLGCIYAVTIGDRLGAPAETMTACEIRSRFGKIVDFTNGDEPTDDSQLTFVTMDAFIESGGEFDMDLIALAHVRAYENPWRGWGRSTRKACGKLAQGVHWSQSGFGDGSGNGVIMKIPPLALWQSVQGEDLRDFLDKCITFGRMTHLGTPALVGGAVHAFAFVALLGRRDTFVHVPTFLSSLREIALFLEGELPPCDDKISSQLQNISEHIGHGTGGRLKRHTLDEIVALFGGGGSYAYYSFGLSYAIWARSMLNSDNPSPFDAVLEAVNAGGDTDTNASIVGSLVGALYGMSAIPQDLVLHIDKDGALHDRIKKFYEACTH
jgi:ADP-ribosylglycohydrolase